jgi:hypothetical protein
LRWRSTCSFAISKLSCRLLAWVKPSPHKSNVSTSMNSTFGLPSYLLAAAARKASSFSKKIESSKNGSQEPLSATRPSVLPDVRSEPVTRL